MFLDKIELPVRQTDTDADRWTVVIWTEEQTDRHRQTDRQTQIDGQLTDGQLNRQSRRRDRLTDGE